MEELTPKQIEQLRVALEQLVVELQGELTAAREGSKPVELDQPIGRLSRMEALQQQQMTKAHRRRIETRLNQAEAALGKIGRGEYGECVLCGDVISFKRLSVRPETPMCLICQSEREG